MSYTHLPLARGQKDILRELMLLNLNWKKLPHLINGILVSLSDVIDALRCRHRYRFLLSILFRSDLMMQLKKRQKAQWSNLSWWMRQLLSTMSTIWLNSNVCITDVLIYLFTCRLVCAKNTRSWGIHDKLVYWKFLVQTNKQWNERQWLLSESMIASETCTCSLNAQESFHPCTFSACFLACALVHTMSFKASWAEVDLRAYLWARTKWRWWWWVL